MDCGHCWSWSAGLGWTDLHVYQLLIIFASAMDVDLEQIGGQTGTAVLSIKDGLIQKVLNSLSRYND